MPRPDLLHVNREARMRRDERPGDTGVVEVDMCQEDRVQVGEGDPLGGEAGGQRRERRARPGIDEHRTGRGMEHATGDGPRTAQMQQVDREISGGHTDERASRA